MSDEYRVLAEQLENEEDRYHPSIWIRNRALTAREVLLVIEALRIAAVVKEPTKAEAQTIGESVLAAVYSSEHAHKGGHAAASAIIELAKERSSAMEEVRAALADEEKA